MRLPPLTIASADYTPVDVYCGLRDQILRLPGERAVGGFNGTVGALMESGHQGAVATLVCLHDGTTSLYLSSGGGYIGAGAHQAVAAASADFLEAAAESTSLMQPTTSYPLARPQHARFYVLTTSGAWTAEAPGEMLGEDDQPLSRLFYLAHAVITAIRDYSEPPNAAQPPSP